jgi:hypothetical protein
MNISCEASSIMEFLSETLKIYSEDVDPKREAPWFYVQEIIDWLDDEWNIAVLEQATSVHWINKPILDEVKGILNHLGPDTFARDSVCDFVDHEMYEDASLNHSKEGDGYVEEEHM